jgi:hypothetical protein
MPDENGATVAELRPSAFEWDVFVSYRSARTKERESDPPSGLGRKFVEEFTAHLQWCLNMGLGHRAARVFWDEAAVEPGVPSGDQLARALACARCLVVLWTPGYIFSPACSWEFAAFSGDPTRRELIIPLFCWEKVLPGIEDPVRDLPGIEIPGMRSPDAGLTSKQRDCIRNSVVGKVFARMHAAPAVPTPFSIPPLPTPLPPPSGVQLMPFFRDRTGPDTESLRRGSVDSKGEGE